MAHFTRHSVASIEEDVRTIMESNSHLNVNSESIEGVSRPFSSGTAKSFNLVSLHQSQFVNLLITFLGEVPRKDAVEELVRFIRTGYVETEEERIKRLDKVSRMCCLWSSKINVVNE